MVANNPNRYPQPIRALGNVEDVRETDPDATVTTAISLWRGMLYELMNLTIQLTGSIAVTQSGIWTVGLNTSIPAGSALIGKVSIDQTTPGTTNAVAIITGQSGVAAGAGVVGATTQRVTLASDDPAVASLSVLDDWDESDRLKANLIAGQAGISAGAGAVATNTPRVTLASDDPGVASLSVLDDWDETDRAKVNIIAGQAGVAANVGAASASTVRTVTATDDPGVTSLGVMDDWDETDRCKVNPIAGQAGVAAGAGAVGVTTQRVTLASDDPAVATLGATTGAAVVTDAAGTIQQYLRGLVKQWIAGTLVLGSGANAIGKLAANSGVVIGAVENNTVATTGGLASTSRLLSAAATTNATSVKGSAGRLYKMQGYNAAAAVRYLKLYNKATAPTVGTDTPVRTIALPPSAGFDLGWGNLGYYFSTGIAFALTTGSADADTGALTAGDILGLNLDYA